MTDKQFCDNCKHAEDPEPNYTGVFCTLKNKYVFYPCKDYEDEEENEK